MSHYVVSDIHGEADRFHRMLEMISFSDSDTLYVLGDVVDRGPEPISLLIEIMHTPNIRMILGNHEDMFRNYYNPNHTEKDILRWNKNGNAPTKEAFEKLSDADQRELLSWIDGLPVHLTLESGARRFYMVHGFPGDTRHDEIWGRPTPESTNPFPDTCLLIGHTPVFEYNRTEAEQDAYEKELLNNGDHIRILHTQQFIDIDCSCGYDIPVKRLAALRLEDMAEFYA